MKKLNNAAWQPLGKEKIDKIKELFTDLYPEGIYGNLAGRIFAYWENMLAKVWQEKDEKIKKEDLSFNPLDPLSRVKQKVVVIAYADSISESEKATLQTLNEFLSCYFPAIRGLHLLPSCLIVPGRFNDGYFAQVKRNLIHPPFGSNQLFEQMMGKYFSMTDFVLNHVDIENPGFTSYLKGDDREKKCFYVFTEEEYQNHLLKGDFSHVFRPRPFPLFTIFRRTPKKKYYAEMDLDERIDAFGEKLRLPKEAAGILYLFNKIKNDQMLLSGEYRYINAFIEFLNEKGIGTDKIFTVSETQEVTHVPYVFIKEIASRQDLLAKIGFPPVEDYKLIDREIFGEEVRALTTFSHIQVDLNTSTFEGLAMLADDFSWYLRMDLNMLRLDAANYAFKKWGTSCFGLSEVKTLMKILYISIECVSPRIVANLEVNDTLGTILAQMSDTEAPPPMMYDFYLPCLLPALFLQKNPAILSRIPELLNLYQVPESSIRFSLSESHDGKSVRGSMDLLKTAERQELSELIEENGGKIKYKSVPRRKYPADEFLALCAETGLDPDSAAKTLFNRNGDLFTLKDDVLSSYDITERLSSLFGSKGATHKAFTFFNNKILYGKEPYELCVTTRNSLPPLDDPSLEITRYLTFHTLAFALMGRNVKSVYFNDLLGLSNDYGKYGKTGELRDIKRTKSYLLSIATRLSDPSSFESQIAKKMNNLIALIDSDPALNFRGNEAEIYIPDSEGNTAAFIINRCFPEISITVSNIGDTECICRFPSEKIISGNSLIDNLSGRVYSRGGDGKSTLTLAPFESLWLTKTKVPISGALLIT